MKPTVAVDSKEENTNHDQHYINRRTNGKGYQLKPQVPFSRRDSIGLSSRNHPPSTRNQSLR